MRYFLEVSYKGTNYSGFQIQHNANTIQSEVEKAFGIFYKKKFSLTGSSRTDAGVHALQNYFHFDTNNEIHENSLYNLNAILPPDIVIQSLVPVRNDSHCRFDAVSRAYKYYIYCHKDPFLADRALYFPYKLNIGLMEKAADCLKHYSDFSSFSKKNTQTKTNICNIIESNWAEEKDCLVYNVKANRFLRGMVRALTATMLKVGRNKLSIEQFCKIIESKNSSAASFAVPAHGLFLISVDYPSNYF